MRKAVLVSAFLLAFAFMTEAKESRSADSPCFTYIGRTLVQGGKVSYDWTGVTAVVRFKGKYLEMRYQDSGTNYVNVWVDKEPCAEPDCVLTLGGSAVVPVVENLKKEEHTVYIQKRTEGEQGKITLEEFITDGSFMQARDLKERKLLFIGDSYTCGYGTEASGRDEPFRASEENPSLTYAAIVGRYFNADVVTVSHSGRGVVRNYADAGGLTMPGKYAHVFDSEEGSSPLWKASAYVPSLVVIYLGTNDFSVGKQPSMGSWCAGYSDLLRQIRADFPSAPILCLASKADEKMAAYVEEAVRRSGISNVHWSAVHSSALNDTSDLGASWHPNYSGHRKVASVLIPSVSTITGWEMPLSVIE